MLHPRLNKAQQFKSWITKIVLPSIRKFEYYKLKKEHEHDINKIIKKINFLEKQNNKLKNELKKKKYPNGSLVYIVDYNDKQKNMYRLGKSNDMNRKEKSYNTDTTSSFSISKIIPFISVNFSLFSNKNILDPNLSFIFKGSLIYLIVFMNDLVNKILSYL